MMTMIMMMTTTATKKMGRKRFICMRLMNYETVCVSKLPCSTPPHPHIPHTHTSLIGMLCAALSSLHTLSAYW